MLARPWVAGLRAVYCSDERKATDGAAILAGHLGIDYVELADLGEVDRSSTGFLPEAEHAEAARLLFERPNESVRGADPARWTRGARKRRRGLRSIPPGSCR